MKIFSRILIVALPLFFSACATMAPPQAPSLQLPKPPLDLRAVRKGDKVTLTWTIPTATTDRQTIRTLGPTQICRGMEPPLSKCAQPVGEAPATAADKSGKKLRAAYVDTLSSEVENQNLASGVAYAVEVLNTAGRGAGLSNLARVPALPTLSPPAIGARVTSDGIVLTLSGLSQNGPDSPIQHLYRVYRRQEGAESSTLVQEVKADPSEIVDRSFEWEKTYFYRATIVSLTSEPRKIEVEGDDSPQLKVFADDVFPPAVPAGLQAVFSGGVQAPFIDLIWAPVTDMDLNGYNVYRHQAGAPAVKVNATLVKAPSYRDTSVESGKEYFYSVSAVDVRENESAQSDEARERVP